MYPFNQKIKTNKMKNIILKSILVLFIGGLSVSCDDELDQIPFDEFGTENAFVTASDFENGIRGAYSGLTRANYFGKVLMAGSLLSAPDILADNVTLAQAGRTTKKIYTSGPIMLQLALEAFTKTPIL